MAVNNNIGGADIGPEGGGSGGFADPNAGETMYRESLGAPARGGDAHARLAKLQAQEQQLNNDLVFAGQNGDYIGAARLLAQKVAISDAIKQAQKEIETQAGEQAAGGAQMGPDPWASFYGDRAFGKSDIQMPGFNTTNQDQARNEQAKVIQALQAQAAGNMNTLGQQQLAQGFQQAGQQQRSLGSSIRGVGGGAGLRAGVTGAADVQRGLAGEQQMLKLQEQQAAQAMLAQLMAQQHAQDVGLAGAMAQGDLQGQGLNQEMERFYGSGLTQNILSNYQRESDLARAKLGFDLGARDLADRQRNQLAQMGGAAIGTGIQAFGRGGNTSTRPSYRQVDGQDSIVPIDDK